MTFIDLSKSKDLLGLSKPMTKLISVISQGVGAISKPYLIRKTADAKAYEIEVISKSISENQNLLENICYNGTELNLQSLNKDNVKNDLYLSERKNQRLDFQEQKRQQNIENITQIAAEQIVTLDSVCEELVDEDWITRFFNYAQDISNEEMQLLWGRILAGEIKQSNTFSIRALEKVRSLSKDEAKVFSKIANYAIRFDDATILFKGKDEDILKKFEIKIKDIALMEELGLILPGDSYLYEFDKVGETEEDKSEIYFGKTILSLTRKVNSPKLIIRMRLFTTLGHELLQLIDISPELEYIQDFIESIKSDSIELKLKNDQKTTI